MSHDPQLSDTLNWLLRGDFAIQYQVYRDLLNEKKPELQKKITTKGWGARFLSKRNDAGHWGRSFYQPKWTSTHYTLMDLRNLCISRGNQKIAETLKQVLQTQKGEDGGINPAKTVKNSDVCVTGMALNYFSYFRVAESELHSIIDFLLTEHMPDGGFNCESNQSGAKHSSLHSTLSVLEGIREYTNAGHTYRLKELHKAESAAQEFILQHRLFLSDRTGEIINPGFLKFSYPTRWKYDVLRALDYFQHARVEKDERMNEAFDLLLKKRMKNGEWPLQAKHPGETHFDMETPGQASRWNTLRALRVMKHFELGEYTSAENIKK